MLRVAIPVHHKLFSHMVHDYMVIRTGRELSKNGLEVTFLFADPVEPVKFNQYYGISAEDHLQYHSLRSKIRSSGLFLGKLLFHLLTHRGEYDLIFAHEPRVVFFLSRFKKILGAPLYYEMHTPHKTEEPLAISDMEKTVFNRLDGMVVTTKSLHQWLLEQYVPPCPIKQIPLACAVYPRASGTPISFEMGAQSPYKLFYVGQPTRKRGIEFVLQALKELPECELHIVGGNPFQLRKLQALIPEEVRSRVICHGYVVHDQVPALLNNAFAVLCPGLNIGIMPYVAMTKLYDYLGRGIPIVASHLPCIREVVTHEKEALLFPPGDSSSFVAAIQRLIKEPELRVRLCSNALRLAEDYTWEKRGQRLASFFSSPSA